MGGTSYRKLWEGGFCMPRGLKTNFTTSLDVDLLKAFRGYCTKNMLYQNEVLEKLIRDLLAKEVKADKEGAGHDDINTGR